MTWPAKDYIKGDRWDAVQANEYLRDPLNDLRAGGLALSGQTAQDFLHASTTTQFGRVAAASGKIPRFNGVTSQWEMALPAEFSWPVGSVYKAGVSTNPATLLGFGVWTAYGSGRVAAGYDAAQVEFDTVGEVGGSKTVTVTTAELPSHTHLQNSHNHTQNAHSHTVSGMGNPTGLVDSAVDATVMDNSGGMTTSNETATNIAATATNQNEGGGAAHQNLMPYIVAYRWVRTS